MLGVTLSDSFGLLAWSASHFLSLAPLLHAGSCRSFSPGRGQFLVKRGATVFRRFGERAGCCFHVVMSQRKLRKQSSEELEHPRTSQWPPLLTGETIQHGWQENSKKISQWKGLVLDQMEVNLSLYLVKYDGFDCVYGIELFKDKRVKKLQILPRRSALRNNEDAAAAEALVGKAVSHTFEKEDGRKNKWRGLVLSRAPIMTSWHYITYEKDPILYMYPLLQDQRDGDLQIIPESENKNLVPPGREAGAIEAEDSLVGKPVEYVTEKGVKKTGMFIYQVPARPSVYFVKFNNDFYIYVYDLVKAV